MGHTGGIITSAPGAEDAEPVIQILVGLPCLERGCLVKRKIKAQNACQLDFFPQELTKEGEPLEVVFVSMDKSPEEMMNYMKDSHGDWLAVQHGAQLAT